MKKCVVLLFCLLMLSGCNRNVDVLDDEKFSDTESVIIKTDNSEEQSNDYYSFFGPTDSQVWFQYPGIAYIDGIYYYWGTYEDGSVPLLMSWDPSTDLVYPVCDKADCGHKTEDCNAWFNGLDNTFSHDFIVAYDGDLLTMCYDKEGIVSLIRVNPDGSGYEKYIDLYQADIKDPSEGYDSFWVQPELIIHRGFIYYIIPNTSESCLRKVNCDTGEEVVIYFNQADDPITYRIKAYGNDIYFQSGGFTDKTHESVDGAIWKYDTENDKVSVVKEGVVAGYSITEGKMIYATQKEIHFFSISSEVDYIMSNPGHRIDVGAFGKEFYTYDSVKKELAIYSLDGELKKTIPAFRDFSLFYMGDDNYIFANDGNFCRMAINDPSTGWQEIKKGDR